MAHIELRKLQYPRDVDSLNNGSDFFKNGYSIHDIDFEIRVKWWQAAALIRLALVYLLRPQWRHLPLALLEKTHNILEAYRRP